MVQPPKTGTNLKVVVKGGVRVQSTPAPPRLGSNPAMEVNSLASKPPPAEFKAPAPPQRSGPRYKEKFQALRERFDQVSAQHDEYQRDLEVANARMRKLQAENDLLLDAISIAVPATPSLMHLIRPSPTGTSSMPMTSYTHPPPSYRPSVPMNGHGYDHANGRYRDTEYDRSEMDPVDRSNDPSPHGSSVNGRSS